MADLTQEYLDKSLKEQTKELKAFSKEQTEELAVMVNNGFNHVNEQLAEIRKDLDVSEQLKIFEKKFEKLEQALNIKL